MFFPATPRPLAHAFPLAILLGALAACGFAPLDLWPLAILCLVGLVALLGESPGIARAALLGWGFGVGHFCVGLNWIATAFTFQAAMPAWLGWIAVFLLSLYLAVFVAIATGLAAALAAALARATNAAGAAGFARATLFAATWIVGEMLRATAFTGFAWNPLAAIWVSTWIVPALITPYLGTYALSGLTILLAGGLWHGGRAIAGAWRDDPARRGGRAAILAAVAIAAATGATSVLLPIALVRPPEGEGPRLRIVQPNINQDEKWQAGAEQRNFARLVALTGPPSATPRIVLWPEVAIPWYLEDDPAARAALAGLLGPRDLMLTGGLAVRTDAAGAIVGASNSLFALDAGGRLLGRYDKSHLVPYGEYLPMRPLLSAIGLSRLAPGDMDFTPGPGPRDLILPGIGAVGGQICYEMIFSGEVVDAAHRPRFLFNPSNDAWFGAWGPPQHLAQARLRAMEEAMPIVRSTPTGISAVIDAHGRLLAALPWHRPGAIDARLPMAAPPTWFARYGNRLPLGLATILALSAFAAAGFASRPRRG